MKQRQILLRVSDTVYLAIAGCASQDNVSINRWLTHVILLAIGDHAAKMTALKASQSASKSDSKSATTEKDENEKERSKEKGKEEKETTTTTTARAREVSISIPTRQECRDYAKTNPAFDIMSVEQFYDYYDAIGWKYKGDRRIRNWKALMRNWARRELRYLNKSKAGKAELAEQRMKRDAQKAREEAAKDPANWALCAERCARFCEGKCLEGAKWPPQFNERPIPPEECPNFMAL